MTESSDAKFLAACRVAEADALAELVALREQVTRGEALVKSIRELMALYEPKAAPAQVVAEIAPTPAATQPPEPAPEPAPAPEPSPPAEVAPTDGDMPDDIGLTQSSVWRFVAKVISETGKSPSPRVIAEHLDKPLQYAYGPINRLCTFGYIEREEGYAVLRVLKWPPGIAPRETEAPPPRLAPPGRAPSSAGGLPVRRFDHAEFDPTSVMALDRTHPAVVEKRTMYVSRVVLAAEADRLLKSGANQRKLGDKIIKGPWAGMPIYALTLEERATCPTTCHRWRDCYGNGMNWAQRIRVDPTFLHLLETELAGYQQQHPAGFAVRLHVLGDFYSVEYVRAWERWLAKFPALHVFGFTAWGPTTNIGFAIEKLRGDWSRFAIRFSSPTSQPGGATTIAREVEGKIAEGIVCPAQTHPNVCCGSCGLCWAPAAKDKTIVFMMHGRRTAQSPAPKLAAPPAKLTTTCLTTTCRNPKQPGSDLCASCRQQAMKRPPRREFTAHGDEGR